MPKQDNTIRLFFKNVNGLRITEKAWKVMRKYKRLKQMWRVLKVDIIGLVETQINPNALQSKSILIDNLFRAEVNFCIFNNNSNEIID